MTNLRSDQAIGVFDSGIGGLTVANAIIKQMPNERIVYFGDTAHLPYGDKSADAIRYYSLKISKFLIEQDCKIIVIACNSASSTAYNILLDFFEGKMQFVNVVDPLVEASLQANKEKVGVIATKATINSDIYRHKIQTANPNIVVKQMATPLLVPMIEEGFYDNNISEEIIENYLSRDELSGIEMLLLACTHYPLIKDNIKAFYNNEIEVLDSTDVVVKSLRDKLDSMNLLSEKASGKHRFIVSDYTESFEKTTKLFYEGELQLEHVSIW